ncbi:hypothetical protein BC835DRAFT_442273 [Cytidiella melzeri]|nr:hypothetical protein BC835DRAFT_442273 [Cytidiella melzeri]
MTCSRRHSLTDDDDGSTLNSCQHSDFGLVNRSAHCWHLTPRERSRLSRITTNAQKSLSVSPVGQRGLQYARYVHSFSLTIFTHCRVSRTSIQTKHPCVRVQPLKRATMATFSDPVGRVGKSISQGNGEPPRFCSESERWLRSLRVITHCRWTHSLPPGDNSKRNKCCV